MAKDGKAELAVSAPQENATGATWSLPGTATGLTATGSVSMTPGSVHALAAKAGFGSLFGNDDAVGLYF
ncbi:hypothetical protein E4099_01110 [Streptomyces palmae]|uniref:Uncharacterized protein n=1 Tax=Streptomyces palmae TaxID=1701085 RepID=A0A4Z0HJD9_9ACTN|nr:hypothetical protein [Streptomyces palmae]TGB18965.1 hypothetical protein E4099_01110 [Streptomyces palmae]